MCVFWLLLKLPLCVDMFVQLLTDMPMGIQLPELHQLMLEAAKILNVEPPDLYVRQSPSPNAYTLAINGKNPFVVAHTSLIELLTRKELQVVTNILLAAHVFLRILDYFVTCMFLVHDSG